MNLRINDEEKEPAPKLPKQVVFYMYLATNGQWGHGMCEFNGYIRNWEELLVARDSIQKHKGGNSVTITGWQSYDKKEEKEDTTNGQT